MVGLDFGDWAIGPGGGTLMGTRSTGAGRLRTLLLKPRFDGVGFWEWRIRRDERHASPRGRLAEEPCRHQYTSPQWPYHADRQGQRPGGKLNTDPGNKSAKTLEFILAAQLQEPLRIIHHDCLSARRDEALFSPFRKEAADGKKSGAGHLGQFLTRKRYLDASRRPLPDLLKQPEKGESNAPGNFFGSHFAKPLFQFIEAPGQDLADVLPYLGVVRHQFLKSGIFPDQCPALLDCTGRASVIAVCNIARYPNGITRSIHPQDNFVSVWTELSTLYTSRLKQHEVTDRLTLHKKDFVTREDSHLRAGGDLLALPWRQTCEERGGAEENYALRKVGILFG